MIYAHNTGKGPRDLYMPFLIWKQLIKTRGPIFKRAFLIKRLTRRISKTDDAQVSYIVRILYRAGFYSTFFPIGYKELLLVFHACLYIIKITKYSLIIAAMTL